MSPAPLPDHCILRPAHQSDRWALQQLVFLLIWAEALGFDTRVISYRLVQIMLLVTVLVVQAWLITKVTSLVWQSILAFVLLLTGLWTIGAVLLVILYIVLIPTEPLFNWSTYWVIEHNHVPVACAALVTFRQFSVLYHVVVQPAWRRKGLASSLVQRVMQETSLPIYLICKPRLIPFYQRCGFVRLAWDQLSKPVKDHFIDFALDRQLSNAAWEVMGFSQVNDDAPPIAVK